MDEKIIHNHEEYMRIAIALSIENVSAGGGPFGAVIVRNGEIIATGVNRVTKECDPTAHAEVQAIRAAGKKLASHELAECILYTSCEPCPMCLGAIYWAHITTIYYAHTRADAAAINFDDSFIYDEMGRKPAERSIPAYHLLAHEAIQAFTLWQAHTEKVLY